MGALNRTLMSMSQEQMKAAMRFNECVEDGQDHDVPSDLMKQLEMHGLVIDKGDGYYEQTDLMIEVGAALKDAHSQFVAMGIENPIMFFNEEY